MTEKEYRQHPAISRSELWKLRESPEKFQWYKQNPPEPTPALLFGQVVHKLILQPDSFFDDFAVAPDCDRRTKAGKAVYEDFLADVGDRQIVPRDLMEQAEAMAEAITRSPYAFRLLTGKHETEHFWTDPDTGEACKCRTDVETEIDGELWCVDYKTTQDASTEGFQLEANRFGYDFQAAYYSDGVEASTGRRPRFAFVAQEKTPPYAVNVFIADDDFIQRGEDVARELLGIYHYCKTTGNWYGYLGRDNIVNVLSLPHWLREKKEE